MVSNTEAVPDVAGTSCIGPYGRKSPEERKIEARERKRINRAKNPEFNRLNDLWARVRKEKADKTGYVNEEEVKQEIHRRLIMWNKKEAGKRDWLAINEERKRRYKVRSPWSATTPGTVSPTSPVTDSNSNLIPQLVNGELRFYTAKELDLAYGLLELARINSIPPRPKTNDMP